MKTNIAISNELCAAVDRLAKRLGISRNDLVRKALERYLEQEAARLPILAAAVKGSIDEDEDW